MKKITLFWAFFAIMTTLFAQEYSYKVYGKEISCSRQKNEMMIYLNASTAAEQFITDLSGFGQVDINKGETIHIIRVKCNEEKYGQLIDFCEQNSAQLKAYCPILTKTNSKFDVSCASEVIVLLKDGANETQLQSLVEQFGYSILRQSPFNADRYVITSNIKDGASAFLAATRLSESGLFRYAVPNFYMDSLLQTDDEYFGNQWGLENWGQTGGFEGVDINASEAWSYTTGSADIKVAIIDCGVELSHPELAHALITGYDAVDHTTMGGNRYLDEVHGTKCAGIIGAKHNEDCIAGIAPNCKIIPVRSFQGRVGSEESIVDGLEYAVQAGADVISCSWSCGDTDLFYLNIPVGSAIDLALQNGRGGKGCVVVFSSGNMNLSHVQYPSSTVGVIAVGAVDHCGQRSGIVGETEYPCEPWIRSSGASSYGSKLSVVAPGTHVYTTTTGSGCETNFKGTSAACPHVSGVAALMLSVNPDLTCRQVKTIIENTATKVGNYVMFKK